MTVDGVRALAKSGSLDPDDMLAEEGSDRWQRAGNAKGLFTSDKAMPAVSHAQFEQDGVYEVEPDPPQRPASSMTQAAEVPFAGGAGGGAVAPGVRALNRSHEAQLLNRWAWRLFIFGWFFALVGGIGFLIQIPAFYLAARASAMRGGRWGERLWRAAVRWLVVVYILVIVGLSSLVYSDYNQNDGELSEEMTLLLVGAGIIFIISIVQLLTFYWGTKPDDPVRVPREA